MAVNRVQPHSLGIGLAVLLGSWHVAWAALVWFGLAQGLIDLIFRLHMIEPPYRVGPFSLPLAASLVLVTAGIGYGLGLLMGVIWNNCVPGSKEVRVCSSENTGFCS